MLQLQVVLDVHMGLVQRLQLIELATAAIAAAGGRDTGKKGVLAYVQVVDEQPTLGCLCTAVAAAAADRRV